MWTGPADRSDSRSRRWRTLAAVVAFTTCTSTPVWSATITDPLQGPFALAPGPAAASELSGIASAGADLYYAVSDSGAKLFSLDIKVDLTTGEIIAASVLASQTLAAGTDLEGLVHHPLGGSVFASDETGPAIREYRLSDGAVLSTISVPPEFDDARTNFSLESLSMRVASDPGDDALWTTNEEALTTDGPLSTGTTGTIVRLQRFDDTLTPDGQWAYITDPFPGTPFFGQERSGVSDLLALPNGELLVLERSFSSVLFRSRIYQVDFTGATDTTGIANLDSAQFTAVTKTRLWGKVGGLENYEGLTLGPVLDAGDRSLLLVSDDGGNAAQALHALRITYVPEPAFLLQAGAAFFMLLIISRSRRSQGNVVMARAAGES